MGYDFLQHCLHVQILAAASNTLQKQFMHLCDKVSIKKCVERICIRTSAFHVEVWYTKIIKRRKHRFEKKFQRTVKWSTELSEVTKPLRSTGALYALLRDWGMFASVAEISDFLSRRHGHSTSEWLFRKATASAYLHWFRLSRSCLLQQHYKNRLSFIQLVCVCWFAIDFRSNIILN